MNLYDSDVGNSVILVESVCCAEIGQVWQKVEDQRPDIQMECITEYLGFQSTCLVWVHVTAY